MLYSENDSIGMVETAGWRVTHFQLNEKGSGNDLRLTCPVAVKFLCKTLALEDRADLPLVAGQDPATRMDFYAVGADTCIQAARNADR